MDQQTLGKSIVVLGVIVLVIGSIIYFFGDKLHFVGRLPGDLRIERENVRFYFPITTMILLSVLISVILRLYQFLR